VVAAFDLSRFRRLADLGGATGHLAIAACERYAQMRAAVFDLPVVIAMAQDYVAASAAHDRIESIAGDFFQRRSAARRSILLSAASCTTGRRTASGCCCRRSRAALPAGGALLIAEKLLDEDKSGPTPRTYAIAKHAGMHPGPGADPERISLRYCARVASPRWRAAAPASLVDAVLATKATQ
jgi:hypothetical protein